jgi:tRNA pseudouridine55 synthase
MDGILLINKEPNMTSRDVVNKVCHLLNTKKVGHTGTLDPMATGVLVLAINKGLKIVNEITALDKEYEAEITLGINTDTLDITGKTLDTKEVNVTNEDIDRVLKTFIGEYNMEVPIYSAIKVNGKKLYEYARSGEKVDIPFHKVNIYELVRTSDVKNNKFSIKCKVSKGTYIRSLVRDISKELGTIGVMSKLNRTKQGKFDIKDCYTLKDIEDGNYKLLDIKDVLDLPVVEVPDSIYNKVINGNKIENTFNLDKFIFTKDNKIIAVYNVDKDNLLKPLHMFK